MNDREYSYLKKKIHELLQIDIDAYKPEQMRRRLESFVAPRAPNGHYSGVTSGSTWRPGRCGWAILKVAENT